MGGRRRDRHARDARRLRGRPHLRGLDRPRCVPALLGQHLPDDDAARGRRRSGLYARARRGSLRHPARPDPRLHRAEGRHLRQHPRHPRDRRQDRRGADRPLRVARGGDRARRRADARPLEGRHRARRAGAALEGAGDDAARPRARLRALPARARPARPLAAEGVLPPLRVSRPALAARHARRGAPGCSPSTSRASRFRWREGEPVVVRARRLRCRRRSCRRGHRTKVSSSARAPPGSKASLLCTTQKQPV